MFLTPAMCVDVLRKLPWEQLVQRPEPVVDNRSPYKGRAPLTLIDEVNQVPTAAGITPDAVIEEALGLLPHHSPARRRQRGGGDLHRAHPDDREPPGKPRASYHADPGGGPTPTRGWPGRTGTTAPGGRTERSG
jgi:hypothetical protein